MAQLLRKKNWLIVISLLLIFSPAACPGAETPSAGARETEAVGLKDYFALLEEEMTPVTTGVSRPLKKADVPASITVITAEEIKLLGLRNLTDVINYIVPGAVGDIHRSTRTGLYAFRGISVDNNGKYVFMIDGLNCGSLTAWGAFNERYLGLMDELERIEIIQGTGSILYGSGAISGVINFITKTGKDFQGLEFTGGYGSWDKVETTVKLGQKISDDEDYFYFGGFKHSQGSVPKGGAGSSRSEHAAPGRYGDHFDSSGKFHANINRGDFSLRMRFVRCKFEEPFVMTGTTYGSDTYWFQNYLFVEPEFRHTFNEKSRIKYNLAFGMDEAGQEKIEYWSSRSFSIQPNEKIVSLGERKVRGQFFYYYDGFPDQKFTSGAEFFWMNSGRDFSGENRTFDNTNKIFKQNVHVKDLNFLALFFEDIWSLGDRTTLFTGCRWEDQSQTKPNLSPRIAISHDLDEKTNLKFLYNHGFRTPDWAYYSRYLDILEANPASPATKPKPEQVDSIEAHVNHRFNSAFNGSLVSYYTIYRDLINYYSTGGTDYGYYNFHEVRAAGLEASAGYKKKNLTVNGSHSFSRPVHLSADNYEIIGLSYDERNWAQFPTQMTKLQVILRCNGKSSLGITYFRPWGIFGLRAPDKALKKPADYVNATYTIKASDNVEYQLSGYNLLGEDHPWWGQDTNDGNSRDIDPHREFFVRSTVKF